MFQYINLDYLESLLGDDIDTKTTMLTMLLDEIPDEINKINSAHQANDLVTLKGAAHKLKSTLAFVGNEDMKIANIAIEQCAKDNENLEQLPDLIAKMNKLHPLIIDDVKLALTTIATNQNS